uniref:DNA-directed RNA polymerase n=2 Tax=Physcomitrium patens TaxID=3218 RepID=A0A7I4FQ66_PHYPA
MKVLRKTIASVKREILSWTDHQKEVSRHLLESQLDATMLDSSIIHSTERISATLDDDKKIKSNSKKKAVIVSTLNRISKDIQNNFKISIWEGYTQGDNKRIISQVLSSKSILDSLSHIKRVEISSKERRSTIMRQIHPTQLGYICPYETPKGPDVGIVKYFSSTYTITPYVDLDDVLNHLGVLPQGNDALFINRLFVIRTSKDNILKSIKAYKRKEEAFMFISIHYSSDKETHIQTTRGKYIKPLLIYTNGSAPVYSNTTVDDMYKAGMLEMIDATEQMQCFIAIIHDGICNQHTHVEIYPLFIFGLSASMTPYANFNQSSRIVFQS